MAEFSHYSVMLQECIDALNVSDGIYVDCTCGGAGHSRAIADRLVGSGRLISIDQDQDAINAAKERLAPYGDSVTLVRSNFSEVKSVAEQLELPGISGALIDLGVSSYQLDTPERGFSYMHDAPLDMRMNQDAQLTAWQVVNEYSEADLKRILYNYGEEQFAPRIVSAIAKARAIKPIETTGELSELTKSAIPAKAREGGHHPAKKSFQAIRIEVNGELAIIEPTLRSLCDLLAPGGRLAVLTFHSLEDRIVKQTFVSLSQGCTCPPSFPVCVCGKKPLGKVITRKPMLPSAKELEENPRSRSAKLRIFEKI